MRKFRFIGDPKVYSKGFIDYGQIVDEDYFKGLSDPLIDLFKRFPWDWEDVTEPNKLHKDTDLGYFAGLAFQGLVSTGQPMDVQWCVRHAKSIIKELRKEDSNA